MNEDLYLFITPVYWDGSWMLVRSNMPLNRMIDEEVQTAWKSSYVRITGTILGRSSQSIDQGQEFLFYLTNHICWTVDTDKYHVKYYDDLDVAREDNLGVLL